MKKSLTTLLFIAFSLTMFAQSKEKDKSKSSSSDTTKVCKSSKSGKHCSKPSDK